MFRLFHPISATKDLEKAVIFSISGINFINEKISTQNETQNNSTTGDDSGSTAGWVVFGVGITIGAIILLRALYRRYNRTNPTENEANYQRMPSEEVINEIQKQP